jgi:uncharacterized repeat protein (TIGR01451 family)
MSIYASAQVEFSSFDTSGKSVVYQKSKKSGHRSAKAGGGTVSIGNYVWFDYNQNSMQDFGELGIYNITVNLYDNGSCGGTPMATTHTSDIGYYHFDNLSMAQQYCLEISIPSYWEVSTKRGDNRFDASGKVEGISLSISEESFDAGLHHKDEACQTPSLHVGAIGRHDHSKTWAKRASLDVKFDGVVASGYCYEYTNSGPDGEKYSVHLTDRREFTDEQRDKLSRLFRFMSDSDVISLVEKNFDSSNKHIWFNVISNSFVWFYSDWREDFTKIEDYIEKSNWSSNLSVSEKEGMKNVSRLIVDKIENREYLPMKVYYLWNDENDEHQDIIVPETLLVPDRVECKIEPESDLITIGNRVWVDSNFNGIQDVSESGYNKPVEVKLYDKNSKLISTTKSDSSGIYSFETVIADREYFIEFSVPTGYTVSPKEKSGSCSDSDVDKNGKSKKNLYKSDNDCVDMGIYIVPEPEINIEKHINGVDADREDDALIIDFGSNIKWSYTISNNGNVPLQNILATDTKAGKITCPKRTLAVGESMKCSEKKGSALEGLHGDTAKVKAKTERGIEVEDSDPTYYRGSAEPKPKIEIESSTNGVDADRASEAVEVEYDSNIIWSYTVSNIGNVALKEIFVKDNREGEVICPSRALEANKSMNCTPKKGKAKEGLYKNIATVDAKSYKGIAVQDIDSSHYKGGDKPVVNPTPPVAKDDYKNADEVGKAVTLKSLKNDSDKDGDIDPKSVILVHPDAIDNGKRVVVDGEGIWSVDLVTGDITFTPQEEFIDDPTPVKYKVSDSKKNWSNIAKEVVKYPDSKRAMLGNRVWFDMDKNGKQDEGEVGIEGIKIELYSSENKIDETKTDENGTYSFVNLIAGEYLIKFIVKDGWSLTKQNEGNSTIDSNANQESGKTGVIILVNGETNLSIDAGMYQIPKPSISIKKLTNGGNITNIIVGDTITWSYTIKNSGNVNLSNIELIDDKEGIVACPQDTLVIQEEMVCEKTGIATLGNYKNSAIVKALDSDNKIVTAKASSYYIGKDAPVELGSLGDRVWLDNNKNGIQDSGELGVSGIKVRVLDANRKEIAHSQTDQNGNYIFKDLEPKEYMIEFTTPAGYKVTKPNQGNDRERDSNSNSNGQTALIKVVGGDEIKSVDMGIYQALGKLGNRVWYDKNENGIQDGDEKGVANIEVKLYDHNSKLIATKSTKAQGIYQFTNLEPNRYSIRFIVSKGYTISPKDRGENDSKDSDVNAQGVTESVTVITGQENNSLDMGIFKKPVKVGDKVWYDANKNGIQDGGESGIRDIKVSLYRENGEFVSETKTDNSGLYLFDGLIPNNYYIVFTPSVGYTITDKDRGEDDKKDSDANSAGRTAIFALESGRDNASIDMGLYQQRVSFGNFVWLDTNHNGIQDEGEHGVKDINVTLFGSNGVVGSMLTDENGNYIFTNIAPDNYYAEFKLLPSGHILAPKNEGDDRAKDSDAYKNSEKRFVTEETTLIAGQNSLEWDMGIYKTVCPPSKAVLGDLVWADVNKNGIQDIGESGIKGIKVSLYKQSSDEKIATTTTDENGNYEFTSIDIGEYYLIFNIPKGYFVSMQDQEDNDAIDSDANEDGRTGVIKLEAGKINSTVDMGLHQEGSTIGDRVWYDENSNGIQDEGELGVNNVTVTLKDATDTKIETITTNATGEYHFTNINVGTYSVEFSNIPVDYIFSKQNEGEDDTTDSDVNSDGKIERFSVAGATNITHIDAGIRRYDMPNSTTDIGQGITGKDVTIDVLSNDGSGTYRLDASTVKITSTIEGAIVSSDGKSIRVEGEGLWRVNPATGIISFTPESGFVGDPTAISYSVEDTHGNQIGSEIKVNYPPVANDDTVNGARGETILIHLLDNDRATSSPLDPISLRLIDPINSSEVERVEVIGQGIWTLNSSGAVIFTPKEGFSSTPTPIEYVVREIDGEVSNRATVTIKYPDAVDDRLIIYNSTVTNITNSETYRVDVTVNDTTDIDSSRVVHLGCSEDGVKIVTVEGEGVWRVEGSSITFTPEDGFICDPTDIEYRITLASGENSNCAIVDIRHEFLALDDHTTLNVGNPTLINVVRNDRGDIVASTVELVIPKGQASIMTLTQDRKTITVVGEGVWSVSQTGLVTFTPESGFGTTPTAIQYTVANVSGTRSNVADIIIGQGGVDLIVINSDIGVASGAEPIIINILDNDRGDINSSLVMLLDANGSRTEHLNVIGEGVWTIENGIVTFTPEEGYRGTPTPIEYSVIDINRRDSVAGESDNQANISIEGECICKEYKSDVPTLNITGLLLLTLLISLIGGVLFKEEESFSL